MEYELTLIGILALVGSGLLAGFVNTLAGGGALFTVPALMLLGMPADVANATNRLGVFLQSATAVWSYHQHDQLITDDLKAILIPNFFGTLVGALAASYTPVAILKPVLLGTMLLVTLVIVFKPKQAAAGENHIPFTLAQKRSGFFWLFLAGLYGGYIQAGVGFVLIAVFSGVLRYSLLQSNVLKMMSTLVFGGVSLTIFALRGQVLWVPGLILSLATMTGVYVAVRYSLNASERVLKAILLLMVGLVCVAAFFKG